MSDFSLLYKKYNSVSNLTNSLNNSVITLKRKMLYSSKQEIRDKVPQLKVSEDEISKARNEIIIILSELASFYTDHDTKNNLYELMDNQLFKSQVLNNVEFKDEITGALAKIKANEELTSRDLSTIDKFIYILDNEASILFRKLRTSRG
jgi:ABC-type bacteriocin/lantibiotic exporter with double-glycine peptidase domain